MPLNVCFQARPSNVERYRLVRNLIETSLDGKIVWNIYSRYIIHMFVRVCITNHSTKREISGGGEGCKGCNVSSLSPRRQSRGSHQSCSIIPWWAKKSGAKEVQEDGGGGGEGGGGRTKGRRFVINGEAIWFLLGDALLPSLPPSGGSPAVNEFVNGGRETIFRESFARISPSFVLEGVDGRVGTIADNLRRCFMANQRAPPSFKKNAFLSSEEEHLSFLFFSLQEERNVLFRWNEK